MSDSISNSSSQIQNAQKNNALVIECFQSRTRLAISTLPQRNGYIRGYRLIASPPLSPAGETLSTRIRKIQILLKYRNQRPAIRKLARVSRPGKKVFASARELLQRSPTPRSVEMFHTDAARGDAAHDGTFYSDQKRMSQGILILSTSFGILSNIEARKLNIGGEIPGQVR